MILKYVEISWNGEKKERSFQRPVKRWVWQYNIMSYRPIWRFSFQETFASPSLNCLYYLSYNTAGDPRGRAMGTIAFPPEPRWRRFLDKNDALFEVPNIDISFYTEYSHWSDDFCDAEWPEILDYLVIFSVIIKRTVLYRWCRESVFYIDRYKNVAT